MVSRNGVSLPFGLEQVLSLGIAGNLRSHKTVCLYVLLMLLFSIPLAYHTLDTSVIQWHGSH